MEFEVSSGASLEWNYEEYIIDSGSDYIVLSPDQSLNLQVIATGPNGHCTDMDQVFLDNLTPTESLDLEFTICEGEELEYYPEVSWWYSGDELEVIELFVPGFYEFIEINECGEISHSIELNTEFCDCNIYVPNALTANSDNINPEFGPVHTCNFDEYHFTIWNRWGEKVFETFDDQKWWSGGLNEHFIQDGVYTWQIEYSIVEDPESKQLRGSVTVLR